VSISISNKEDNPAAKTDINQPTTINDLCDMI
jgi:hypothetical protein